MINKIKSLFTRKRKPLGVNDIFNTLGGLIKIGKDEQLVESVTGKETPMGYTITITTLRGDWSKEIYK